MTAPLAARAAVLAGLLAVPVLTVSGCAGQQPAQAQAASTGGSASAGDATGSPSSEVSQGPRPSAVPSAPLNTGAPQPPSGPVSEAPSTVRTAVPWQTDTLPPGPPPASAGSGTAQLTILLDDGFGIRSTWTLTCDPAGGTHPDPATACGALGAKGAQALPAVKPGVACSQIYGGPQKARITGAWRGRPVEAQFDRENGCETARWDDLSGLLPRGGVPGQ